MAAFTARFKSWGERIDELSLRERALIFFAVMIALYLVAHNVVFAPLAAEQGRLQRELAAKREQIQATDRQLAAFLDGGDRSAQDALRARLAALRDQSRALDAELDEVTSGLVSPREMAKLVEQVLERSTGLELLRLEALAPEQLQEQTGGAAPGVTVYRHGMRVEFEGRYFDIVEYLEALESLPWKVFWGEVQLATEAYPVARVSLLIYTLSRDANWIGV
jgi:MSHA biogenesis protein MshJ